MTTAEPVLMIILILIGVIVIVWAIDRICKSVEKCKTLKIIGEYIKNLNENEMDNFMKDFNNAMRKGLGK